MIKRLNEYITEFLNYDEVVNEKKAQAVLRALEINEEGKKTQEKEVEKSET